MAGRESGAGVVPVERAELVTQDMELIAELVPWAVVGRRAEEATGLPAADLRFESMPPVSAARQAAWARTAGFICHELVSSGITEVSPLMAQEMKIPKTSISSASPPAGSGPTCARSLRSWT